VRQDRERRGEGKKNYADVEILVFATAEKVKKHTERHWQEEIRKEFALELIVVSRKDLVTSLLDPANTAICSATVRSLGFPWR
jgi:hypothetical protein